MANLLNFGAEMNSAAAGIEAQSVNLGGAFSIVTTPVRSGTYSLKETVTVGGRNQFVWNFGTGNFFAQICLNIQTLPGSKNAIIEFGSGEPAPVCIKLDTTGVITLEDEDGQIGSASSALSLNTWYVIEVQINKSGGAGAHIVRARIDGTEFAGASNRDVTAATTGLTIGAKLNNETTETGVWYFDDVIVHDTTGSFNNSWVNGAKLIMLKPNAAGDNTQFTPSAGSNYDCVNEVPPSSADSVGSLTLNHIDDYNLEDSGLSSVSILGVFYYFQSQDSAGAARSVARIKASSGGTVEESAAINSPTAYGDSRLVRLALYDQPGASTTAWTPPTLDSMQAGMRISTGGAAKVDVSFLGIYVEYVESTAVSATGIANYGALQGLAPAGAANYEALKAGSFSGSINFESLGVLLSSQILNYEFLKSLSMSGAANFESLQNLPATFTLNYEALKALFLAQTENYETLRLLAGIQALANFESVKGLAGPAVLNYESFKGFSVPGIINYSVGGQVFTGIVFDSTFRPVSAAPLKQPVFDSPKRSQ